MPEEKRTQQETLGCGTLILIVLIPPWLHGFEGTQPFYCNWRRGSIPCATSSLNR